MGRGALGYAYFFLAGYNVGAVCSVKLLPSSAIAVTLPTRPSNLFLSTGDWNRPTQTVSLASDFTQIGELHAICPSS